MHFFSYLELYSEINPKVGVIKSWSPLAPRIINCHELFFMFRIIFEEKYNKYVLSNPGPP
jgi:hypothetical protein